MTELTPFAIYLIFTADGIKPLFGIVGFLSAILGAFTMFYGLDDSEAWAVTAGKRLLAGAFLSFLLAVLTPNTKTLVAMYGIPAAIDGAKNVATSEVGQKAYSAVNKLLDSYLKDK